jgi:hypothetical protein
MRSIYAICHPKKLGLRDHADALIHYGRTFDPEAMYHALYSFSDLSKLNNRKASSIAVIWDNSLFSLAAAVVCRLRGTKVLYYLHEPGGLGQKLAKDDPLFYAFGNALGELLFRDVANYVGVPRYDRIAHGDVFLPLPLIEERPPPQPSPKLLGFVGARRTQRLLPLFVSLEPLIREAGLTPAYFPSAQYGSTTADKFKFLSECAAVWNAYGVPYNQSGVAFDALMSSVPVIGTSYEPFRDLFLRLGLFHELRLEEGPEAVREQFRSILKQLTATTDRRHVELAVRSEFGGAASFRNTWLKFFQSI